MILPLWYNSFVLINHFALRSFDSSNSSWDDAKIGEIQAVEWRFNIRKGLCEDLVVLTFQSFEG